MSNAPKFGKFEERLARRIAQFLRGTKTCTPKKPEIIFSDPMNDPESGYNKAGQYQNRRGQTDRRAFKNLVALGLVKHSQNGHCWLTEAGMKKLRLKAS